MNLAYNKALGTACFLGFFIAFSICLTTASQSADLAPSYDASGSLQYRVFLDGKLYHAETNNFVVQVRGSIVKIRAWGFSNTENAVPASDHIFSTDGFTAYHITTFDLNSDAVARSQTAAGNQMRMFNIFADLFTNECPPNMTGNMGPVWIATASAPILKNLGQQGGSMYPAHFICPDWPDIGGERLKASWSLSGQPPYLPEHLVEYSDENVYKVVNNFFQRWKQKTFPPVYKDGYTNAIYEALSWSDVNGLHIPSHFRLTSYIPRYDGGDNQQLQVLNTYDGFITNITTAPLDAVSALPAIPAWSRINEYRYGTINNQPATYTSQTGALLTKDEVLKLMGGRVRFGEQSNLITSGRSKMVLAGLLCLTVLPICILLFRKFRRNA